MKNQAMLRFVLLISLLLTWQTAAPVGAGAAAPEIPAEPQTLSTFTTIAVGDSFACALTSGGGVQCWGTNDIGQLGDDTYIARSAPVTVSGLASGTQAIAAGQYHACALTSGGGVKCWGVSWNGQLGNGSLGTSKIPVEVSGLASGVQAITTGYSHTCALLSGGGVQCWGANNNGQLGDGTTTQRTTPVEVSGLTSGAQAIAASGNHTCVLLSGGGVKCWGANNNGQLGDGTTTQRNTPVEVSGLGSGMQAIAAGGSHTCAVTSSGGVKCWGENGFGQLGDGTSTDRSTPVDVSELASGILAINLGANHSCALTNGGGIKCWGSNYFGQLGDGSLINRYIPVEVSGLTSGGQAIAAGMNHTCAVLSGGEIWCWGANWYGQLGNGSLTRRSIPVDVSRLASGVQAIQVGFNHTCALLGSGGVQCWGYNTFGQLGDGTSIQRGTPVDVSGLASGVQAIAVGGHHTCALTGGGIKCWGANGYGQVGNGTSASQQNTPVDVSGLTSGMQAVTAGGNHTCGLTSSGGVICWGFNGGGQLGNGTTTNSNTPVDVSGLASGAQTIAAGGNHTCALTSTGGVKCWGFNNYGQLGDGTTTTSSTPVDVSGLASGVQAIAAGMNHTCALISGGGVKCWGLNSSGQLGNGNLTSSSTPVDVSGLASGVQAVSAGGNSTCALLSNAPAKCWGNNEKGQLGDGTLTNRNTPVEVSGLASGGQAISVNGFHTCALAGNGRAKCWGLDLYGELGVGTISVQTTPVRVVETPAPILTTNYLAGQPGSFFTLTGWNFSPNSQVTISANLLPFASTVPVNETGSFVFFLDTTGADPGRYIISTDASPATSISFSLDASAPLRIQEGGGQTLVAPPGLGSVWQELYLPLGLK